MDFIILDYLILNISIKYYNLFYLRLTSLHVLSPQWFCSQIWLELINDFKKATIEGIDIDDDNSFLLIIINLHQN